MVGLNGLLWFSLMHVVLFFRLMMDVKDVGEQWIEYKSRRNAISATYTFFCYAWFEDAPESIALAIW